MIKHVLMFTNGNIACTDEDGKQVPEWQAPLLCDHLRRMYDAGAIDRSTQVLTAQGAFDLDEFLPFKTEAEP